MSQDNLSLKERIQLMAGDDNEPITPTEFSNLILDDTQIKQITQNDKEYLNLFVNLEKLCMNHTGLKNLSNLPDKLHLVQLELTDNHIDGTELNKILVFKNNLAILKISNNKIDSLEQVKVLAAMSHLVQLDLSENPVC